MEQLVLSEYLPALQAGRRGSTAIPSRLIVPFDFYLQGWGWHSNEFTDRFFRWIGNEGIAQVRFIVDRSRPLMLELTVHVSLDPALEDEVALTCDGVPLSATKVTLPTGSVIRAELPASSAQLSLHISVLTISVPRTVNVPGDGRNLSIGFSSMTIEPLVGDSAGERIETEALVPKFFPVFAAALGRLSPSAREAALALKIGRASVQSCYYEQGRESSFLINVEVSNFLGLQGRFDLRCRAKRDDNDGAPHIGLRVDGFEGMLTRLLVVQDASAGVEVFLSERLNHPSGSVIVLSTAESWIELFIVLVALALTKIIAAAEVEDSSARCFQAWQSEMTRVSARLRTLDPGASPKNDHRTAVRVFRQGR